MQKIEKNKVKVAVLGLGYMGQNHVRVLAGTTNVEIKAICDIDKNKTEQIAKEYKTKAYNNISELLSKEKDLNAVFVCLPTTLHFAATTEAIKNNLAVFIEKPIATNVTEAKKIIAAGKKFKTPIMVGHIERFNPVIAEIKRRLKSKELGKIHYIKTQRFSPHPARASDVSAIIDLATHDIDIICYLLNEQQPTRIYAETEIFFHNKEDIMSAILRFKSKIIGLVEVSWLHPTKIRNITIVGENGMYSANYITQELFFYKQNENIAKRKTIPTPDQTWADVIKVAFESKEPLQLEINAFLNALVSNSQMPVTAEDGTNAIAIAHKMAQSGEKHRILK